MPDLRPTQIEVYVFRRRGRRVEFLCLRRAPGRRLTGVWQPVTGKLRRGEGALAGAAREVGEETGLTPQRWWALEGVAFYFDAPAGVVRVLARFAAEVGTEERVTISREHTASAFLGARGASRRFLWGAQRRGLEDVRREVLRGGALAHALEVTTKRPANRPR
ncbi:MAG TPA: NUDIX domain-containing protein [Candidatus Eisenbacteria bacterium]